MTTFRAPTGLVWHERYMWHSTGVNAGIAPYGGYVQPGEPAEHPETKRRFKNLLDVSGLTKSLKVIEPQPIDLQLLHRVHSPDYVASIAERSAAFGGEAGPSTPFGTGSYEIALISAGGVVEAVRQTVAGEVANAYALVRPPGHHATRSGAMGFCLFANAALAGRAALDDLGLDRVAFVDWDVHHGNGTQDVFWEDPRALTLSIHQDGCFPPDSGHVGEIGAGAGEGFNVNVPLPPGSGLGAYAAAFDRVVLPALHAYKPDLIIVPSGFDAGGHDPLGRMMLHSDAYRDMTRKLMTAADELCGGRIVMSHEGGYSASTVPFMGLAVLETLSGVRTDVVDPFVEVIGGMAYQGLQSHQEAAVEASAALVRESARRW